MWAEFASLWLVALLFAMLLMVLVWRLAVGIANAGIVDIAWAGGFTPVVIGMRRPQRRRAPARPDCVHGEHLEPAACAYLYVRVRSHHPNEDRRYARLRRDWGTQVNRRMFWFFQLQAALLALLSTPWLLICLNRDARLQPLEWAACLLWLAAIGGEALADRELQRFKADPANRGAVCQHGLWRYSRHPNYFFEWLVWVAYFAMALASPWGWLTLDCPALMLYFLVRVTGIPLTEQLSLQAKGAAYAEYQRRTSAFVPWWPKHS